MNDAHQPRDVEAINRQALEELAWAIEMSQGQFTLLLARSNYEKLRDEMAARLQEVCPVPIRSVWLDESVTTLYSALREELGDEQPEAVMVFGLEAIAHLEQLLASTNQVRDEFRQAFPFPLVLWVNDDVLTKLIRLAPDFHSWSTTTEFAIAPFTLCETLRSAAERIFTTMLTPDSNLSFLRLLRGLDLTILQRQELRFALHELRQQNCPLEAEVQASLDFFRGVSAGVEPEALHFLQNSLTSWQACDRPDPLKTAMALHFIGRYHYYTAFQDKFRPPDWNIAKAPLENAIALLDQENRPDLVAKAALQLARVLDRAQAWDELDTLIKKVLPLHQVYGNLGRIAQDYRYLAVTSMQDDRLTEAKAFAEQAIATLDQVPEDAKWKGLYLLTLAQVERKAGNLRTAIDLLQTAYTLGDNGFPRLYVSIIEELRSLYIEQKQYLEAFQLKQRRLSVEQQFGLRAFVGAGRLNPTREDEEKRLLELRDRAAHTEEVPPEIRASGRQKDLNTLLERIGRSDYQLIVVHGFSGVGKSSLVTAGLAPALRGKTSLPRPVPVLMRRYVNWVAELALQLGIALHQEDQAAQWDSPDAILQQLRHNEQRNLRPVLIFDQFEEFFFAYPDVLERRSFFDFLGRCLQEVLSAKVILSLREDYLYYLLELNRLTSFQQRGIDILSCNVLYPLGNFAPNDAKAIIQDLTDRAKFYLEADLIDALVTDLSGELGEVRPIELQVVGAQLQDDDIRSLTHYRQYGSNAKEVLVQRYLDQSIADCGNENSQLARLVLYLLTDEKGTRPLKTRSEIERDLFALLSDSSPSIDGLDLILTVFVGSGLVLLLPEQPADRYQLVHDYIAEFIRQQQSPQLQRLIEELAEERKQRQLTEAELAKAEEAQKVLAVANQKAKRRLLISSTLLAASLIAAIVAIPAAIKASNELGRTRQEADRIQTESQQKVEQASAEADQRTQAADRRVQEANTRLTDAQQKQRIANEKVEQANREVFQARANLARLRSQAGQQRQQLAEQIRSAEVRLASAETRLNQARREQAQAQRQFEAAQGATELARKITQLEQSGSRVLRRFVAFSSPTQRTGQLETLLSAVRTGQDLKRMLTPNQPLEQYPTSSPTYAIQQILQGIRENNQFHADSVVFSVSYSPNGQQIVTGSDDGKAIIWNVNGERVQEFQADSWIRSVDYSPNGQQIVTGSDNGEVIIWNVNGERVQEFQTDGWIKSVSYSPNGQQIVTVSNDGKAIIWNVNGERVQEFQADSTVWSVSYSPNGQQIVTGSEDGKAIIWNVNGERVQEFQVDSTVWSVSYSPNGQQIVTGLGDGKVIIWNVNGERVQEFQVDDLVRSVSYSPNGQQIITVLDDGKTTIWSLNGQRVQEFQVDTAVLGVSYSPNGQQIVTGSADKAVTWNLNERRVQELQTDNLVRSVSYSPNGQQIVTGAVDEVIVWNLNGERVKEFQVDSAVWSVSYSPNGQQIVTGAVDGKVIIWNLNGERVREFQADSAVWSVSYSPNGQQIVTGADDGRAIVWSLNGEQVQELQVGSLVRSVSYSPSGQQIATGSVDGKVVVWNLSGERLKEFQADSAVLSVSYSPNGQQIVTGSGDGRVIIWNLDGERVQEFQADSLVWSVSYSPNGQQILSASRDGKAIIWNLSGERLQEFQADSPVWSASYSPNGQQIATGSEDGEIRLHPIYDIDGLLTQACDWLRNYLTYNPNATNDDRALCNIPPRN